MGYIPDLMDFSAAMRARLGGETGTGPLAACKPPRRAAVTGPLADVFASRGDRSMYPGASVGLPPVTAGHGLGFDPLLANLAWDGLDPEGSP